MLKLSYVAWGSLRCSPQCRRDFGTRRLIDQVFDAATLDCNWMTGRGLGRGRKIGAL